MKLKHILLALLTAVIIGICIASPFVVSVIDNNRLLSKPVAETAEPVDASALNTEKREMSHAEKIQLYFDYSAENSSVTRTANKENHTLMTKQEAADKGKQELINLAKQLGHISSDQLNALGDLYVIDFYQVVTYVDQDDPSRHVIFWILQYEASFQNDMMFATIMMDDETGKIYQFAYGLRGGESWGQPLYSVKELSAISHTFADYLGFDVEWPEDFYSEYRDPFGGTAYVLYRDNETGNGIPYEVGLWSQYNLSFTLPSEGNAIAEIVYYKSEKESDLFY